MYENGALLKDHYSFMSTVNDGLYFLGGLSQTSHRPSEQNKYQCIDIIFII
jgi:hypothetical protein